METSPPTYASVQPPGGPAQIPKRRRRWWLYALLGVVGLGVVIVATVAITLWWIQRPIKPVVLTANERAVVEEKLEHLGAAGGALEESANTQARGAAQAPEPKPDPDPQYVPGGRELRLTERELNGLLNENTELGQTLRLDFGRDAINAYMAVPIPQDFPIGAGKTFRARGRFRVSYNAGEAPYVILEDITVFGVSLPKAWLGGLKGENLLENVLGDRQGRPVLQGVKSLKIVPGALVLEVEE